MTIDYSKMLPDPESGKQKRSTTSDRLSKQPAQPGKHGGHRVGEKYPEFSRLFYNQNLLVHNYHNKKSNCNNDLHQGSFHINASE